MLKRISTGGGRGGLHKIQMVATPSESPFMFVKVTWLNLVQTKKEYIMDTFSHHCNALPPDISINIVVSYVLDTFSHRCLSMKLFPFPDKIYAHGEKVLHDKSLSNKKHY